MTPLNNAQIVITDANILIALCAKEPKQSTAEDALEIYASKGFEFYAPSVIVPEVLFVLCKKHAEGFLTDRAYQEAIENFQDQMSAIITESDADLIKRATEIHDSLGCSRSADSIYIALAEKLSKNNSVEILTFDKGFVNHVSSTVPNVKINLLPA
jgi:predicted nucleic acid-binding protein